MKTWGVSYGLIGDLIMALPCLTYFRKKWPNCYNYWVIQRKVAQCAPIFINHPMIDRIVITEGWQNEGFSDKLLRAECDFQCLPIPQQIHQPRDWYNYTNAIEETAKLAGIKDLTQVLSPEEMTPYLDMWFPIGPLSEKNHGYSKKFDRSHLPEGEVAIWPFANYKGESNRSPSILWWTNAVNELMNMGFNIKHYGYFTEPTLSDDPRYEKLTELPYFSQVKLALASRFAIGTDSGSMWVMGAYKHPSINLMTNWLGGHRENPLALEPANSRGKTLFAPGSCSNIPINRLIEEAEAMDDGIEP